MPKTIEKYFIVVCLQFVKLIFYTNTLTEIIVILE